jgi:hypothetical protein
MHRWHRITRVVLTLMAAAFLASVSVTAAQAGHGRGRGYGNVRYKGGYQKSWRRAPVVMQRVVYAPRPVFVRPAYGMYRLGAPVSGGFLAAQFGGVSFGLALANRPAGYVYEDPYCHTRYTSLSAYRDHCGAHRHEVVVRVIHEHGGYANRGYHDDGAWQRDDGYYDDSREGQDDQYREDDGYQDRGQDENWDDQEPGPDENWDDDGR